MNASGIIFNIETASAAYSISADKNHRFSADQINIIFSDRELENITSQYFDGKKRKQIPGIEVFTVRENNDEYYFYYAVDRKNGIAGSIVSNDGTSIVIAAAKSFDWEDEYEDDD